MGAIRNQEPAPSGAIRSQPTRECEYCGRPARSRDRETNEWLCRDCLADVAYCRRYGKGTQ